MEQSTDELAKEIRYMLGEIKKEIQAIKKLIINEEERY